MGYSMHEMHDLTDLDRALQAELASGARSAVRFPIHLPVRIMADGGEWTGETENFSSSGALLRLSGELEAGSRIEFLVEVPAAMLGEDVTAAVHCAGQVLRSYEEDGKNYSAIVIHDYRFQ